MLCGAYVLKGNPPPAYSVPLDKRILHRQIVAIQIDHPIQHTTQPKARYHWATCGVPRDGFPDLDIPQITARHIVVEQMWPRRGARGVLLIRIPPSLLIPYPYPTHLAILSTLTRNQMNVDLP